MDTFLNEYGYLLDYRRWQYDGLERTSEHDFCSCFRLFSIGSQNQKKSVLDIVTRELLTPKGFRSLSPKSGGYNPNYVGPQSSATMLTIRVRHGHGWMDSIWRRTLRIYKRSALSFVERQMIGYEDEMTCHCLGSIPGTVRWKPTVQRSWRSIICNECGRDFAYARIYWKNININNEEDEYESINVWMGVSSSCIWWFGNCQLWYLTKGMSATGGYGYYIVYP